MGSPTFTPGPPMLAVTEFTCSWSTGPMKKDRVTNLNLLRLKRGCQIFKLRHAIDMPDIKF